MRTTIKNSFAIAAVLFAGAGMAGPITPDSDGDGACDRDEPGQTCWQASGDNSEPNLDTLANLVGITDEETLSILYKDNAGGSEEGSLTGSYSTEYTPAGDENEASGAIITYTGGTFISCPECYLWVKDGNHDPSLYVFDISWWDGMTSLTLDGFWTYGGAISNIGIFGRGSTQVPEPGTLGLLGIAALGFGLVRRRKI